MKRSDTAWALRNDNGVYLSTQSDDTGRLSYAQLFRSRRDAEHYLKCQSAFIGYRDYRPVRVGIIERKVKRGTQIR